MKNEDPRMPELNRQVTAAIFRAEHLPIGPERHLAFVEVGRLEEAIAEICPQGTLEGDVARRGAVTAALSACDPLRALILANQWVTVPYMETLRAEALAFERGPMKIFITCVLEDPNSDHADRLLSYLAKANWRNVEARSDNPKQAMAQVKGIILHAIGDFPEPPDQIRFSCIDLSKNQTTTDASS